MTAPTHDRAVEREEEMAEMERPIEEEFAVVVAALLAGRIDGQQAVQSSAALHRRVSLSWLASVLADDATVEVVARALGKHQSIGGGISCYCMEVDEHGASAFIPEASWENHLAAHALAALSAHLTAPARAGDTSGEEGL